MLNNDKITLRAFELEDSEIVRKWRFDFDNYDYFYEFTPISRYSNEIWVQNTLKKQSEINFIIEDNKSNTPIGMISIINIDCRNQKCEMGRVLIGNKKFRGKGIGLEGVNLLINYAFNHLNMRKVYCEVFADNAIALSLYKKVGFLEEGVLKEHIYKNGQFKDIILMAKIKN